MRSSLVAFAAAVVVTVVAAPTLAQPSAPTVTLAENSRARRGVERCLERVGQVPTAPNPDRAVAIAEGAERFCRGLSRRDSALDDAVLEGYQRAMLAWAQAQQSGARSSAQAVHDLEREFLAVARRPVSPNWTGPDDTARIARETEAWMRDAAALAERIRANPTAHPASLGPYRTEMESASGRVATELAELRRQIDGHVPTDAIMAQLQVMQARWTVARTLLPDEPTPRAAERMIQMWAGALEAAGGASGARAQAQAQQAAGVRMPTAQGSDARLEAEMRSVFEAQGWNEPVLALRITSPWADEVSPAGQVVGRRRDAAIAVRLPDGTCRLYDFTFYAPRAGSGWGPLRRSSHASRSMACANVPR